MKLRALLLNWRDINNPWAGGAEVHIWEVFGRLASQGWDVQAICAKFAGAQARERVKEILVHRCGGPYRYSIALPRAYRSAAKEFRPHVVIDFMNKLPLFTPLFVKEPLICFVHHLFGSAASLDSGLAAGVIVGGLERFVPIFYANTPCLAGSVSTISDLESIGLPRKNLISLPYGVDVNFYRPAPKAQHPLIVYVGRLKKYKGIADLIKIAPVLKKRFPDLQIKIAGQGGLESNLKSLIKDMNLDDSVEVCGFVSEEEKRDLYQKAWLTCLLSAKEGFGLTIAEAALCGTPTIGYDVPGVRDAIKNENTGLLTPFGDTTALIDAITRILSNKQFRDDLGKNGLNEYHDFSWDRAAALTDDTIQHFLLSKHCHKDDSRVTTSI